MGYHSREDTFPDVDRGKLARRQRLEVTGRKKDREKRRKGYDDAEENTIENEK